jgi:hypothetical protein
MHQSGDQSSETQKMYEQKKITQRTPDYACAETYVQDKEIKTKDS